MVKQYVGARYVPKFASPVEWAADTSYEALTIVTFNNASYTSKVPVPPTVGNPANNPQYWALTGNYNAQVEQYRQETENVGNNLSAEVTNRKNEDTNLQAQITTEVTNRKNEDAAINDKFKKVLLLLGDSWPAGATHGPIIANTLKNFFDEVYNYAVSGAHIEQIGDQATKAKQAGISPSVIYIICGTNNVFHTHTINFNDLDIALDTINSIYPKVPKHFFPDNSKTGNEGYTYLYGPMCYHFTLKGYIVHKDTLAYLTFNSFQYYNGNDLIGVQHLSEAGEKWFAKLCYELANGACTYLLLAKVNCSSTDNDLFTPPNGITYDFKFRVYMKPDGSGELQINIKITNNSGTNYTDGVFTVKKDKLTMIPFNLYNAYQVADNVTDFSNTLALSSFGRLDTFHISLATPLAPGASKTAYITTYLADVLAADGG